MELREWTYKSSLRSSKVPTCTIDVTYLAKLFDIINNINLEAAQFEISKIDSAYAQNLQNLSRADYEKIKEEISSGYRVHVQIFGSKGEYYSSESLNILNEKNLPDVVTTIKFDNKFFYKNKFNRDPVSVIDVELDFTKPPLFDFVTNPSLSTTNNSKIQFVSENETWSEGAHEKVISSLKKRSSRRSWLHRSNTYDIFLWLLVVPVAFWNVYKFDLWISKYLKGLSSVFYVALYLYIFIMVLNIFRFIFNYLRWLFPYLELKTSLKKGAVYHRFIFAGMITAVFSPLIHDLFVLILKKIFSG